MPSPNTDCPSGAKIAFCLMVHDNAPKVGEFASLLIGLGHEVFIHLDASLTGSRRQLYIEAVQNAASQAAFVPAVRCEWGSWNLVAGTLNLVRAVVASGKPFTHVQLLSGADLPTQNITCFGEFLMRNPESDFIDSTDIAETTWVVHGPEKERFEYIFPFNWRRQRTLFDITFWLQKLVGFKRKIPCGIRPRLGSQWWTLRLSTCRKLLTFLDQNPAVSRYFKRTLIPDECFFQSLIPHLVDVREVVPRTLTLYKFTGYGKPFVFYDDHLEMLVEEPFFFARKVSPVAMNLQKALFERAVSGPRPEWSDHRAGHNSWKLRADAIRAFKFTDPMIGHIGNAQHRAITTPAQECVVLVCTDPVSRHLLEQKLREAPGIQCVDWAQLPPYRTLGHASQPTLNSFLANEVSMSSLLTTCIVTTTADFGEVIDGFKGLPDVKVRCAMMETPLHSIHQPSLHKTLPNYVTMFSDGEPFPVFLVQQASEMIAWITDRQGSPTSGDHAVRSRVPAAQNDLPA